MYQTYSRKSLKTTLTTYISDSIYNVGRIYNRIAELHNFSNLINVCGGLIIRAAELGTKDLKIYDILRENV